METYEPVPGRSSLVARIAGTDPDAPALTLLGHTDVVPANADDWTHDPFGGELIDGMVWGRGAIDMLNLTSTMATGLRHLALSGFRPTGDLTYIAVADEEALSTYGAKWLCANAADDIRSDYVITESGGFPMNGSDGLPRLPVIVVRRASTGASSPYGGPPVTPPNHCGPTMRWSKRPRSSVVSTSTGPTPSSTRRGHASSRASGSHPT